MRYLSFFLSATSVLYPVVIGDSQGGWNQNPNGEIEVTLPSDLAQKLNAFVKDDRTTCPVKRSGSVPAAPGCLYGKAYAVLQSNLLGGIYDASKQVDVTRFQPPTFIDAEYNLGLSYMMATAGAVLPEHLQGIDTNHMAIVGSMAFAAEFVANYDGLSVDFAKFTVSSNYVHRVNTFQAECPVGLYMVNCENAFCVGTNGKCALGSFFSGCDCETEDKCVPSLDAEEWPDCTDQTCNVAWSDGDDEICKKDGPQQGCPCLPVLDTILDNIDPAVLVVQNQILAAVELIPDAPPSFPNNPPQCFGINSVNYMTYEAAMTAKDSFCGSSGLSGGPNEHSLSSEYYQNTNNWVQLKADFHGDASTSINSAECKVLFKTLIEGCDGNDPDNPSGAKHGGTISYPGNGNSNGHATLYLTPRVGQVPHCNGLSYGRWVKPDDGKSAYHDQFCKFPDRLSGKRGDRKSVVAFADTVSPVTLTIRYFSDASMSQAECEAGFKSILDNCDGNDDKKNPLNLKFGGTFSAQDQKVLFVLDPVAALPFPQNRPAHLAVCTAQKPPQFAVMLKSSILVAAGYYCDKYENKEYTAVAPESFDGISGEMCSPGGTHICNNRDYLTKHAFNFEISAEVVPSLGCKNPLLDRVDCRQTLSEIAFYCDPYTTDDPDNHGACYVDDGSGIPGLVKHANCPPGTSMGGEILNNCYSFKVVGK